MGLRKREIITRLQGLRIICRETTKKVSEARDDTRVFKVRIILHFVDNEE